MHGDDKRTLDALSALFRMAFRASAPEVVKYALKNLTWRVRKMLRLLYFRLSGCSARFTVNIAQKRKHRVKNRKQLLRIVASASLHAAG